MSAFVLKIIAMVSMLCDHSSYLIFGHFSYLNYIGRIAFPIFAFQISEGYIHTRSLKNYFIRLFSFALISQIPFMLFGSIYSSSISLNVFFTLFLGLLAVKIFDTLHNLDCKNKYIHYLYNFIGITLFILIAIISSLLHCDYGYYGVTVIFMFHLLKSKKILMNIVFIICTIIFYFKYLLVNILYFEKYSLIIFFTCLSLVFINLYNNKKGKDTKYLLYLFYPLHLLVIWLIYYKFL